MSTATQYNPQDDLNKILIDAGCSKTVYALETPETRRARATVLGYADDAARAEYEGIFTEAWTHKQDAMHEEFFETWINWSHNVVDFKADLFPFRYPTAGASQGIQHLIFDHAVRYPHGRILFFEGEYEGYKAMAEAANVRYVEVPRDNWRSLENCYLGEGDLYFVSQPSAIDGNLWSEFNEFVEALPTNSVVVDVTYVGAVPHIAQLINLHAASIRNVVFSLSKPFGVYYDRVGGVFSRTEDAGLFGNKWFKNLTSLRLGTTLMKQNGVFDLPRKYLPEQNLMLWSAHKHMGVKFKASDVYILATAEASAEDRMDQYLRRGGKLRICLTPGMYEAIQILEAKARGSCL